MGGIDLAFEYEPLLGKACKNVFGGAYEYTYKYMEYQKMRNEELVNNKNK